MHPQEACLERDEGNFVNNMYRNVLLYRLAGKTFAETKNMCTVSTVELSLSILSKIDIMDSRNNTSYSSSTARQKPISTMKPLRWL